jgi:hypothetical protein
MFQNLLSRLSSAVSSVTGRYAPAFITTILLAGFFIYYFNVVIASNESELKERKYRGLYRMAINITKKVEDYSDRNVHNFLSEKRIEPVNVSPVFEEIEYGLHKDFLLSARKSDSILVFRHADNPRKLYFGDSAGKAASVYIDKFIDPILRRDLFPYYMLSLDDSILHDELNIFHQKLPEYNSPDGVVDSVIKGPVKQTGYSMNIEVGGRQYKLLSVPFTVKNKYKFQIGGYLPIEEYENERKSIPTYAILWLVIGIAMVILMIPLLKIFMMHPTEQLVTRNATAALASIHILAAVFILAALNTYIYFTVIRRATEVKLEKLAMNTDSIFRSEVEATLAEIKSAQSDVAKGLQLADIAFQPDSGKFVFSDGKALQSNVYALPRQSYPFFKHIVWTDKSGLQQFRWTKDSSTSRKINIKERDYFKAVVNKELWGKENSNGYYFTSILSWVSDKNLALVATPYDTGSGLQPAIRGKADSSGKKDVDTLNSQNVRNKHLVLVSLSGRFRSLFDPVLPYGFGFAIVKNDGEVLFHSDNHRNLNENLVAECNNNQKLHSLLQNRSTGFFGCRYSGTHQRFYTMPIHGMPYSIVTFKDMKLIWSEDLDVISACSILVLINLAIILFAMIIIRMGSFRPSAVTNPSFLFSWLRPNYQLKKEYVSLSLYYLFSSVLLVLLSLIYTIPDQLTLVGATLSYSYILVATTYHRLTIKDNKDVIKASNSKRALAAMTAIYLLCAVVFSINLKSALAISMYAVSQLSLIAVYLVLTFFPGTRFKAFIQNYLRLGKSFGWWYILFLFAFIVATSIIPLMIFYQLCYKEERLMSLRYMQWEFAGRLPQRQTDIFSSRSDTMQLSYDKPYHYYTIAKRVTRLKENTYLDSLHRTDSRNYRSSINNRFSAFYKNIKPAFSLYSNKMELLKSQVGQKAEFAWSDLSDDSLEFFYKISKAQPEAQKFWGLRFIADKNNILLEPQNAWPKNTISFILFTGTVLALLWLFYFILSALIKRIFFDGYTESVPADLTDMVIQQAVPKDGNIFVYGPASTGKFRSIIDYIKGNDSEMLEKDLARLKNEEVDALIQDSELQQGTKKIIVLQNIESQLGDAGITEKKLAVIEKLLQHNQQVIILSSRSFDALPIKRYFEGKPEFQDFSARWSNVLNSFYTVYHKWKHPVINAPSEIELEAKTKLNEKIKNSIPKDLGFHLLQPIFKKANQNPVSEDVPSSIDKFIDKEVDALFIKIRNQCCHSDFLWSLYERLLEQLLSITPSYISLDQKLRTKKAAQKAIKRQMNILFDNICLKMELLAQNYYLSIWESLTRDEQRTLYDIALDELVNPGNRDMAARLADLGLVCRTDQLACYYPMNRSFRNFIFTHVSKNEITSFRDEVAEKGFWRSFQLPLIIVILAVSLFLFITQRDAFNSLVGYLGAAVAGIAGLLRVLAIIPSSKT